MADLCLDTRRPFALLTSVRRTGGRGAHDPHPQIELHLPSDTLRLRFADPDSLDLFLQAVTDLYFDATTRKLTNEPEVSVRLHRPQAAVQLELPY